MVLLRVRLRLEVRVGVLLLGLERSKQDVIQLSSLLSHGRVVGVSIICVWKRDCVGCLWFCMLIPNMPSPVSTDTRVLLSTVRQSILRELPNVFQRLFPWSLWSGLLGTLDILGMSWRMRLQKQAAHNPEMSATRHVGSVDPLLSPRQLDWFFLPRLSLSCRMQYPSMVDGAFSVTQHEELLSSVEVASMLESSIKNVSRGNDSCTEAISLRVASANVNTLSPSDDAADGPTLSVTGRILALQSQFAQCGLQIVGIQEGRMRASALRTCPDFFCLVSTANASGCFGCELWVSTAIP